MLSQGRGVENEVVLEFPGSQLDKLFAFQVSLSLSGKRLWIRLPRCSNKRKWRAEEKRDETRADAGKEKRTGNITALFSLLISERVSCTPRLALESNPGPGCWLGKHSTN